MDDVEVEKLVALKRHYMATSHQKKQTLKRASMIQVTGMMILKSSSLKSLSNLRKPKHFNL